MNSRIIFCIIAAGIVIIFVIESKNQVDNIDIVIEGLHDKYKVGQEIEFLVTVKGYGSYCDKPTVVISKNLDGSDPIWISNESFFIGVNCTKKEIHETFRYGVDEVPLVIEKPGKYFILIPFEKTPIIQSFIVEN